MDTVSVFLGTCSFRYLKQQFKQQYITKKRNNNDSATVGKVLLIVEKT